jgi:Flp pilus assembly protein TadG
MALIMVGLIGFLGLAIDIGMLSIAKTQAQNAADLAALTAARTLNGNPATTYNNANATTNAQNLLTWNYILGQSITSSQLTLTYGSYDYNQTTQTFNANYPATSGVPYTAVAATVTSNNLPGAFSKVFGSQFLPNVTATSQAVHRPRDIGLVMDLSGSMRFGTCLGFDFYTSTRTTNNPDTNVPSFGHYSSASANLIGPSTNSTSAVDSYTISPSNTTVGNSSYTRTYINNFYANAAYASPLIRAFDSYTSTDGGNTWTAPTLPASGPVLPPSSYTTTPGGDQPLFKSGSTTVYAKTDNDVVNQSTRKFLWELDGYSGTQGTGSFNYTDLGSSSYKTGVNGTGQSVAGAFNGYTKGPGYYGKTFFIWPPDPRRPLSTVSGVSGVNTNDANEIKQFLYDIYLASNATNVSNFNNSAYASTLNGAITAGQTTIAIQAADVSKFPSTNGFHVIVNNSEIMIVTAGAGSASWTVQRGKDGTTAVLASNSNTVALLTAPALMGIYTAANTSASPGQTPSTSQTWPWPSADDASGTTSGTLSYYLTHNVYAPASLATTARFLQPTDVAFQQIMRLYNWNYAIDANNTPCDWRVRFFGTNDNTKLFNGSGSLNPPGSTGMCSAVQTYNEILRWINQSTDPFPSQLRAGRVKYYGAIPNPTVSAVAANGTWAPTYTNGITGSYPSWGSTDQRFWVEFINHVLGYVQTGASSYTDVSAMAGYGSDYTWGTVQRSTGTSTTSVAASTSSPQPTYMNYTDNPLRPRLRLWFSPILMVDMLQSYNLNVQQGSNYFFMQPGDSYEAPLYTGKEAFLAAVDTMQNNHPNDWFTLAYYSWPRTSANDTTGRLNGVACPLGTNYAYAKAALLFPFSTINADGTCNNTEVTPYDPDPTTSKIPSANFLDIPRGDGDTTFAMGLMLCYNQFAVTTTSDTTLRNFTTSTPITFPSGMSGGQGRKGAQKLIIFETDGLANCSATASLISAGTYKYYQIRYDMNKPSSSEYPTINATNVNDPTVLSQVYSLVDQLKNDYGTARNPFRLYTLGFGPVFSGPDATAALTTLQTMQYHAGTQSNASTPLPSNQIVTGTDAVMLSNMESAFTSILQNGVQIALIK